jgi:hypothetical protein
MLTIVWCNWRLACHGGCYVSLEMSRFVRRGRRGRGSGYTLSILKLAMLRVHPWLTFLSVGTLCGLRIDVSREMLSSCWGYGYEHTVYTLLSGGLQWKHDGCQINSQLPTPTGGS